MKATALMVYDNTSAANFKQWAWGQGSWPSPTSYGISTFISAAGFVQTGNTSTFGGTLERSNIIGDGQTVFNTITFNVTSTQSTASVATYALRSKLPSKKNCSMRWSLDTEEQCKRRTRSMT